MCHRWLGGVLVQRLLDLSPWAKKVAFLVLLTLIATIVVISGDWQGWVNSQFKTLLYGEAVEDAVRWSGLPPESDHGSKIAAFTNIAVGLLASLLSFEFANSLVTKALDKLAPGFPVFLSAKLSDARASPLSPFAPGQVFVGREEELRFLRRFAGGQAPLLWCCVAGASGMGKTRLAIKWLEALRGSRRKWDAGFLTENVTVAGWRPRRPTAIIVDEPADLDTFWSLIRVLDQDVSKYRHPVRVVLLSSCPVESPLPPADPALKDMAEALRACDVEAQASGALVLQSLSPDHMVAIARGAGHESIADDAAGRPVFGKLGTEPWAELERYGASMIETSFKHFGTDGIRLLALTALAGPFASEVRRRHVSGAAHVGSLQKLFPDVPMERLRAEIPRIEPNMLAQEVLLQVLTSLQVDDARHILDSAYAIDADRASVFTSGLWEMRPEAGGIFYKISGRPGGMDDLACSRSLDRGRFVERINALEFCDLVRGVHMTDRALARGRALKEAIRGTLTRPTPKAPHDNLPDYWVEEHVATPDGLKFRFQQEEAARGRANLARVATLWSELCALTSGWLGNEAIAEVRLEGAGLAAHEYVTHGLSPVAIWAAIQPNLSFAPMNGVAAEGASTIARGLACWGAFNRMPDLTERFLSLSEQWSELAGDRGGEVSRYLRAFCDLIAFGRCEELTTDDVHQRVEEIRKSIAASGAPESGRAFLLSFLIMTSLQKEPDIELVEQHLRELDNLAASLPQMQVLEDMRAIGYGIACRVISRKSDFAAAQATLNKLADLADKSPETFNEELISSYAQVATGERLGLEEEREILDSVTRIGGNPVAGRRVVIEFWYMIAHFHVLKKQVARKYFDNIDGLWAVIDKAYAANPEPKFRYWWSEGFRWWSVGKVALEQQEPVFAKLRSMVGWTWGIDDQGAANQVVSVLSQLAADAMKRGDPEDLLFCIAESKRFARFYPSSVFIQSAIHNYGGTGNMDLSYSIGV